ICQLPPSYYVAGLVGFLFRVENVLVLHRGAILLELAILTWGTWLLARSVLRHDLAAAFATLVGTGAVIDVVSPTIAFRMYYFMPVVLYLLLRFARERRPLWLALA